PNLLAGRVATEVQTWIDKQGQGPEAREKMAEAADVLRRVAAVMRTVQAEQTQAPNQERQEL
ncbi:hypothetical protein KIPB_011522, partial [Kipferlia bialata]